MKMTALAAMLAAAGTAAQATDFNASVWFPETHPLTEFGYIEWAKALDEASGGDLNANVFTGTVLLPPAAHLSGLRDGVADVTYHAGTYTAKDLPVDNLIAQLMFNYSDYFTSAFAFADFAINNEESLAQYKDNGIVFGGSYSTPPYRLFCRVPVTTLDEIEGKTLRLAVSGAHTAWADRVGAVNVSVPSSEMYNGLDKGQLDCASNAANDLKSRSLWDVAKHTTMIELGVYWSGWEYAFNRGFWASLTDGQRRTMLDTIADAIVDTGLGYLGAADEAIAEAKDHGVTVHQPSEDLSASVDEHKSAVRKAAIDHGTETLGLEDSEALVAEFEETYAKWEGLLEGVDKEDPAALKEVLKANLYDKIDETSYGLD